MELRNVTTFLKAAQLGNFTRTAEELGYAPSTITMQIKQLEEELGFPLFDRIGRKISLTALGGQFLSYAKLMESLSEKVMLLGKESLQISGTVRIGILESLFASVLLPLLPEYSKRFPSVTLEFKTASTAELFTLLKRNELDIIFVLDKKIVEKDCIRAYAKPEGLVFAAAAAHPLGGRHNIPLCDILKQPLILTEKIDRKSVV